MAAFLLVKMNVLQAAFILSGIGLLLREKIASKNAHASLESPLSKPPLNRKAPNVGAGANGIWEHREETQRPLHETMRLAEARGSSDTRLAEACPPKLRNIVKYRVEEMRPKWPFWKHRAPKMRLVEAQCGHRKHCYPEIPLGSHPTSRVSQLKLEYHFRFPGNNHQIYFCQTCPQYCWEFHDQL